MHALADIHTPFHIDFAWWSNRHRNLGRFLAEILGEDDVDTASDGALDVIDPHTAEVVQVDPLWARVILERANRPDYITATTPMANALLRALVENLNRPMSALELQRRIDRATPDTVLKVLRAARLQYGIVPVTPEAEPAPAKAAAKPKAAAAPKAPASKKAPAKA